MINEIEEGAIYRHYKGDLYQVIKIACHTEIKEVKTAEDIDDSIKYVVYKPLKTDPALGEICWVRPYAMFVEKVIINGIEQPRFCLIDND